MTSGSFDSCVCRRPRSRSATRAASGGCAWSSGGPWSRTLGGAPPPSVSPRSWKSQLVLDAPPPPPAPAEQAHDQQQESGPDEGDDHLADDRMAVERDADPEYIRKKPAHQDRKS